MTRTTTDGPPGSLPSPLGEVPMGGGHAWYWPFVSDLPIVVATLPIAALTVWVLARRRRGAGTAAASAWRRSLADVAIVCGTLPFLWMTMVPGSRAGAVTGRVSFIPFRDLATMPTYQVVGNLLGFAALGFLAPLRFRTWASLGRIMMLAGAGSILIETAQYVLRLDRVSSVDDVLLNTAGAVAAAAASRRWWRGRPGRRSSVGPSWTATLDGVQTPAERPPVPADGG